MHHKQSGKADKRQGAHHQRTTASIRRVLNPRKVLNPWTSGHDERQTSRATTRTHFAPTLQKYIRFLPFSVSENPEKTPSQARKNSFLPLFALIV